MYQEMNRLEKRNLLYGNSLKKTVIYPFLTLVELKLSGSQVNGIISLSKPASTDVVLVQVMSYTKSLTQTLFGYSNQRILSYFWLLKTPQGVYGSLKATFSENTSELVMLDFVSLPLKGQTDAINSVDPMDELADIIDAL